MFDKSITKGSCAYLEASGQFPSKHEAIQFVCAVGHEVALVPHPPAYHASGVLTLYNDQS